MSTSINSFLSTNNSNSVNELFKSSSVQPKKGEIPVKLIFTAGEVGVSSNPRKRSATVTLTENQIEAKIFAHFGLDAGKDSALIKKRLGNQDNPFEQLETKGIFQATYNLKTGNYEIIDNIEAGLYKALEGKAAQIKTDIEAEKQADANKNPNTVMAEKTGIDNTAYARNELEKKYIENQPPSNSVSAVNKTEADETVRMITDTIEKVTGTENQFSSNTVGEQFNRLGVSGLRLTGKAMEASNYFSEKINDAIRYVAPDSVDELLNEADRQKQDLAKSLQNANTAVTLEDDYIDKSAAKNGWEIPVTEGLANKVMYFPDPANISNAADSAIKGEFKDDDGTYSDTFGKFIGGLNPVADVRDIIADGKRVLDGESGSYIKLGASIIGAIPGGGDILKPIIKKAAKEVFIKTEKELITEVAEKLAKQGIKKEAADKIAKEEVGKLVKEAEQKLANKEAGNTFPRGFENVEQFNKSILDIKNSLKVGDAAVGVRGSSVTGVKFESGKSFDASSDIDFFVVSDKLYTKGIEKGAKGSNGAFRVGATRKYFPEIHKVEKSLSEQLGRKVTVRIFNKEGFEAVKAGQEILVR